MGGRYGIDQDPMRVLRGRLGAHTPHSRDGSRELIKPARKAFESMFEREVDPDVVLPLEERLRRAEMARKAHFAWLAMLSAKARRKKTADRERAFARWKERRAGDLDR